MKNGRGSLQNEIQRLLHVHILKHKIIADVIYISLNIATNIGMIEACTAYFLVGGRGNTQWVFVFVLLLSFKFFSNIVIHISPGWPHYVAKVL